ncbi:MAG: hypothetical protein J0I01_08325 [Stenotrophomonas nitritireducens]|uniref:hypothetical protein n=1 Tax=Stenotrophomonas nitritireducens TaxID=83617 RepID=UPI000968D395|nr:hypothetical protein [Stenotrophomonas nitritireducens]MBN8769676.1 hypothetical protein [Stenotrophomonas sp.]MBN8792220.1 hypothetical protein [Stenotrophomonas nitritireducens]MBN8803092.1 hypothetical protein [Stenotrophomonas acidaminiphila]OJY73036.1 MAG: hypothetical protein BGP18_02040 [Stenotrophomonas sp. 69-14]
MKKSWQTLPLIDHLLFRELFREVLRDTYTAGSTLRPSEDYVVTSTGVRWKEDEDAFVREMGRMLGVDAPEIAIYVRENIRQAQLDFPCSPAQALEWVQRDDGRCARAPDWLTEALMQPDVDHALAIVEGAQPEPAEEADEREQREEGRSIRLAAEALGRIKDVMPPPDVKLPQRRVRPPGHLVALALGEMGCAASTTKALQVMNHLRSWDATKARAHGLTIDDDGKTLLYLTEEGCERQLMQKQIRDALTYRRKNESAGAE